MSGDIIDPRSREKSLIKLFNNLSLNQTKLSKKTETKRDRKFSWTRSCRLDESQDRLETQIFSCQQIVGDIEVSCVVEWQIYLGFICIITFKLEVATSEYHHNLKVKYNSRIQKKME